MTQVLHATSRGQVTLPKSWREQFQTQYFVGEMKGDELVLKPLLTDTLSDDIEASWRDYKAGKFVTHAQLMKKYGL